MDECPSLWIVRYHVREQELCREFLSKSEAELFCDYLENHGLSFTLDIRAAGGAGKDQSVPKTGSQDKSNGTTGTSGTNQHPSGNQ